MRHPTPTDKTIGRLSLYRRLLEQAALAGRSHAYSHDLAGLAGVTSAQVRRDIMALGYHGNPSRGYEINGLVDSIEQYLDQPGGQRVALAGVGNLGRAIMAFFTNRRPHLRIVAAFDTDPDKTGRLIAGCPCHPMSDLARVVDEQGITVGIITVPAAAAQAIADQFVRAGCHGLLNFAPVPLQVPNAVYVEDIDMTMSLEKVAFFARHHTTEEAVVS